MAEKVIINPLTRISGFLEIEVMIDNHRVVDAKSSGMLFRGFEKMLQGRPPLDAIYFTQRICGICSTAHSIVSALALEKALNIIPNKNDDLIRQFVHGCEFLQNHLRHFYQYTFPDYIDGPDINPLYKESVGDYRLPKNLNEKLSRHYLESLKFSRDAHKMLAILAGKAPHNHGVFVGGITVNINASIIVELQSILSAITQFIEDVMVEDVYILSKYYGDYFDNGRGYGNFMSYGVFDENIDEAFTYVFPGVFINHKRYPFLKDRITENVTNAWYEDTKNNLLPQEGFIEADVHKKNAYTWVKAPRYGGYPMEVGPLARMWLSGEYTRGISTMDRTIARVLEAKKIATILDAILSKLVLQSSNQKIYDTPMKGSGIGLKDTTRGSLGHWIAIEDQKIKNYTIITPTTWNLSPTDSNGIKGVVEKALIGTRVKNIENPVEIGRIVRSFDPCVSCATHLTSKNHSSIKIRVV